MGWEVVDDLTGPPGTTDHGAQTGLGDDDHSQYHTDARGDARYYTKTLGDARYRPFAPRVSTEASSATPTINTDNVDQHNVTALAVNVTSVNVSGTPTEGQRLLICITPTANRALAFGSSFENGAVPLPVLASGTTRLDVFFIWNSVTSKWRCMAWGP